MPKKKAAPAPPLPVYNLSAATFGGQAAETFIPQLKHVIEALEPEHRYSFWCGLLSGFAGMANGTLPRGHTVRVLESVLDTTKRNLAPPPEKLN